jgi:hypothetical protein
VKTAEAQTPIHIGGVVRNAQVFNFRNPRGRTVSDEGIFGAVARLFSLLAERRVDYLLVGGIAVLQYVEGRNTEEIELVVPPSAVEEMPEIRITGEDGDFRRADFDGLRIDLLLTSHPLFARVRQRYATTQRFVEREIPCATVEGLLILKLYALPSLYRQGDLVRVALYETDVLNLLDRYRPPTEPLLDELKPHLNTTDLAAVRKIVAEIEEKIERFDRGPGRAGSA